MCGRVVNTSNSGSGGPGFKPRPSRFSLRQGTLLFTRLCVSSPRCINGFRRHIAGGGGNLTLRWTIIQSREGVAILLGMLHATETVISSGSLGLVSSMPLPFLFYYYYFRVKVCCITSVEGIKITVRLT